MTHRHHCRINICRELVELTNTVFVTSTNIATNIETAALSNDTHSCKNNIGLQEKNTSQHITYNKSKLLKYSGTYESIFLRQASG